MGTVSPPTLRLVASSPTYDDQQRFEARKAVAMALFLGWVEGAMQTRGTLSDAGLLDLIGVSLERAQKAVAEIDAARREMEKGT